MNWTQISVIVDGEAAEAVAEVLRPFAHGGVHLEQQAADLSPDATAPQLEQQVTVSIYLLQTDDNPALRHRIEEMLWHLGQLYPIPAPTFTEMREEDWATAWKQHYKPLRMGRHILICPAWEQVNPQPDDLVLLMDPGMAFGTGLHPTTRMCLEVVEELAQPGMTTLDLGTGSGILSIAAAKLGAAPILALDTDEVAVRSAHQNCAANRVAELIQVKKGSLDSLKSTQQWDLVLVNILATVIVKLFGEGLAEHIRPGGLIVLAGIIEEQGPDVLAAMKENEIELVEQRRIKDWITLIGQRPEQK